MFRSQQPQAQRNRIRHRFVMHAPRTALMLQPHRQLLHAPDAPHQKGRQIHHQPTQRKHQRLMIAHAILQLQPHVEMLGRLEQGQRRLPLAAQLVQTVQQGFPEAPSQPVGRHLEDLLQPPDAQTVQPLAGPIRQAGTTHRHPGQQRLQLCRIGGLQAILQPGQQMGRPGKRGQRNAMAELQIRQLAA